MIIVNDKESSMVFSDKLAEVNIHTNGLKIMATFSNAALRSIVLAEYKEKRQSERAFGMLLSAMAADEKFFIFPKETDERLNTTLKASGISNRTNHTNGKTK